MNYILYILVICSDNTVVNKLEQFDTYDVAIRFKYNYEEDYFADDCRVTAQIDTVYEKDDYEY